MMNVLVDRIKYKQFLIAIDHLNCLVWVRFNHEVIIEDILATVLHKLYDRKMNVHRNYPCMLHNVPKVQGGE